jgi:hypothetical protein
MPKRILGPWWQEAFLGGSLAATALYVLRLWQTTRERPPAWGYGRRTTTACHKRTACYTMLHWASDLDKKKGKYL